MTTAPLLTQYISDAQKLDARLSVLTIYDDARRDLGYDFGNAQRHAELIRVRRERDFARTIAKVYGASDHELIATPEQCLAAHKTISTQRLRRYQTSAQPATAERAMRAWRVVERELERSQP